MVFRRLSFCLLFLILSGFQSVYSSEVDHQNIFTSSIDALNANFDYLEDVDSSLTISDVLALNNSQWRHEEGGGAKFGFSRSSYWFKLTFTNQLDEVTKTLLEIGKPTLNDVAFYQVVDGHVVRSLHTGDQRPFYTRDVDHPNYLFRVTQRIGETSTVYFRVKTQGSSVFPIKLWQEKAFFEFSAQEQKVHFLYFGSLLAVVLLNLSIFAMLREKIYFYYSLATVGYLLFFSGLKGFSFQHLFFGLPSLNTQVFLCSMPILAIFSLLFTREFLKTHQLAPRLDQAIKVMLALECVKLIGAFVLNYDNSIRLSLVLTVPFFLLLFFSGPIIWRKGSVSGGFFTCAWSVLTVGMMLTFLRVLGVVPDNFLSQYGMLLGSALESLILMVALSYRIYHERESKIAAQQASIEQTRQKRESQEQFLNAMLHDPVTQLPNRTLFEMALNEQIASFPENELVVLLVRIERFTEVSRTLGLSDGESLLQELGRELNESVSKLPAVVEIEKTTEVHNYICNFSTDTFGVLFNRSDVKADISIYTTFIDNLSKPFKFMSFSVDLHPRCGASFYPRHGDQASTLLRNASVSLDANKGLGSKVSFYSKKHDDYSESRLTLMSDLRFALENDEPELHYQPKLRAHDHEVVGMEALIRWTHPTLGFVSPDKFIPLAEKTGVICLLTRWVFERAMKDYIVFRDDGYDGSLSINISARNLMESDLPNIFSSLIDKYEVDAGKIIVELTETAIMEDPEAGIVALKALTDIGVRLSIDDFGSGYSSLSYLKRLPATEIKLDRALITDIASSDSARVIVQTSIDMAHNLGYNLVAEGVETQEEHDILCSMQCDNIQGYFLSRPLTPSDMNTWLVKARKVSEKTLT